MKRRRPGGRRFLLENGVLWQALERQAQRHLNLARAADRFVGDAETAKRGTHVKRGDAETAIARGDRRGQSLLREAVEVDVLTNVIDRNVEARRVGEVINIETISKGETLCKLCHFDQ